MLTPFGKALRMFRLERGELLKEMAERLQISPAYLSSVENGKKEPTSELMMRITSAYPLSKEELLLLEEARAKTLREVRIAFSSEEDEEVGLLFARKLGSLSDRQRQALIDLLNEKK